MRDLIRAASEFQKFLRSKNWKFCFIGGITVQCWGEPRLTTDVDVTVLTGFGGEEAFIQELLKVYEARIDKAEEFALKTRVVLLRDAQKIGIDVSLGGIPFEESIVRRAKEIEFLPGTTLLVCTPEDLIVLKAFAGRSRDWLDVEGVVTKQGKDNLDWNYIETNLKPLVDIKGQPELLDKLRLIKNT